MWKCVLPLAVVLAVLSATASAQTWCGEHDNMVASLARTHGESEVATALVNLHEFEHEIELFANRSGSSFSFLLTGSDTEKTCFLAGGFGLRAGGLAKTEEYFPTKLFPTLTKDYPNLVVIGTFDNGLPFAVLTSDDGAWRLHTLNSLGVLTPPLFEGKGWKATSTDPEV